MAAASVPRAQHLQACPACITQLSKRDVSRNSQPVKISCIISGFAMQAAFVEPEDDSPHQMSHKLSQPNSHQIQLSVPERLEDVLSSAVLDTKLLNSQVGSLVAVDSPLQWLAQLPALHDTLHTFQ